MNFSKFEVTEYLSTSIIAHLHYMKKHLIPAFSELNQFKFYDFLNAIKLFRHFTGEIAR